jgi:hypothetical protein
MHITYTLHSKSKKRSHCEKKVIWLRSPLACSSGQPEGIVFKVQNIFTSALNPAAEIIPPKRTTSVHNTKFHLKHICPSRVDENQIRSLILFMTI